MQILDETFDKPEHFDVSGFLHNRWGISNDQQINVIVRFKNTVWHPIALEKLRADVSRRQLCHSHCQLDEQGDGSIILHDKVKGLSEFARWLRSYGDAAEVLEPESLRQKMALTGRKMLERYGQGGVASEQ